MVTRCCRCSCFVLLKMGDSDARNMYRSCSDKINSVTCSSCWNYIPENYIPQALNCLLHISKGQTIKGVHYPRNIKNEAREGHL